MRFFLIIVAAFSFSACSVQKNYFVGIQSSDIKWQTLGDAPGFEISELIGQADKLGPLVVRVRLPAGYQVEPHFHDNDRVYTVLSGVWGLALGNTFEAGKVTDYHAGSVYYLPAGIPHFQRAGEGGAVVQISSVGPSTMTFVQKPVLPR